MTTLSCQSHSEACLCLAIWQAKSDGTDSSGHRWPALPCSFLADSIVSFPYSLQADCKHHLLSCLEALGLQRAGPELEGDTYVEIAFRIPPSFILLLLYSQWDLPLWTCLGKPKEAPDSDAGPLALGRWPGCLRRLFRRLAGFVGLSGESQSCAPRETICVYGRAQGRYFCLQAPVSLSPAPPPTPAALWILSFYGGSTIT